VTSPTAPVDRRTIAVRVAGVGAVAAVLGAVHLQHRPATLCLFRATTGIPCPFCGGTTAVSDLGRLDVGAALAASPLAVLLVGLLPVAGVVRRPRWWVAHPRLRRGVIVAAIVTAELWQLVRFHVAGL
jgi:uncharacterized protein DUF2752